MSAAAECSVSSCAFPRVDDTDRCEQHDGKMPSPVVVYTYAWKNNDRRAGLHGRRCVVEASGSMGTALVRFLDTGEKVTTSRRALRRVT